MDYAVYFSDFVSGNKPPCVIAVCRYCESRRRVLLQHVHEGYDKDLWEYIED